MFASTPSHVCCHAIASLPHPARSREPVAPAALAAVVALAAVAALWLHWLHWLHWPHWPHWPHWLHWLHSSHLITPHHTSSHLITPHRTSSHFITTHHTASHLITPHHTSSHLITPHHNSSHACAGCPVLVRSIEGEVHVREGGSLLGAPRRHAQCKMQTRILHKMTAGPCRVVGAQRPTDAMGSVQEAPVGFKGRDACEV